MIYSCPAKAVAPVLRTYALEREKSMRDTISGRPFVGSLAVILLVALAGCSSSTDEGQPMVSEPGHMQQQPMPPQPVMQPQPPMGMPNPQPMAPVVSMPQEGGAGMQEVTARHQALQQQRQEVTKSYIDLGNRYLSEGRMRRARQAFGNALKVDPQNKEAQEQFNRVSGLLGENPKGMPPEAASTFNSAVAATQQAHLMARERFNLGNSLMTESKFAQAIEEYEKAILILQYNPSIDADFDLKAVKDALASAKQQKTKADEAAEADRIRSIAAVNDAREREEQLRAKREKDRLWQRAMQLFDYERFGECEKICDDILRIDFTDGNVRKLKEHARRARHQKANADNVNNYRHEWTKALEEVKALAMPLRTDSDPIFPSLEEWRRINQRGPLEFSGGETQVSEMDDEVRRRLEGTTLNSVDWTEKSLDDAVKFIRSNTSTNIVIMKAVDDFKPLEERTLNLTLDNISAMAALQLAVQHLELGFNIEDGIVKITTKEQLRKNKVVEFFDVRDLTAKLNSFPGIEINLNPSGFGAGLGGFEADDAEGEENRTIESDQLQDMIRKTVDPVSWDEDPENTMVDKEGTLVIRQTPENQRKIRQLLSDLRKSTGVQVRIESRFISVENNFLQEVGVDLRGLGDNSGGIGVPGRGTAAPFDDFGLPGDPNLPLGTGTDSGAFYSFGGGNGNVRGRTENLFDIGLGNPDVLTGTGGFSLQYTYLDDTQLEAILRAVQKYERINTVTAPTLVVYNTQRANLQVTNQIAYVKDFDVEIAQAAVIADPIVDTVTEGVVLDVRPIVSNDRRFVTLELRPTVATLVRPIRTFSSGLGVGTAVTFEVPELRKESLKTTVVMPDGGTLLLGGLKFYEEQDLDSGIPVLKDIPILSFFFSRKGKYTNMRDLIILLRVKVLIMEEYEPNTSGFRR